MSAIEYLSSVAKLRTLESAAVTSKRPLRWQDHNNRSPLFASMRTHSHDSYKVSCPVTLVVEEARRIAPYLNTLVWEVILT